VTATTTVSATATTVTVMATASRTVETTLPTIRAETDANVRSVGNRGGRLGQTTNAAAPLLVAERRRS
jgi:hypothetical protein